MYMWKSLNIETERNRLFVDKTQWLNEQQNNSCPIAERLACFSQKKDFNEHEVEESCQWFFCLRA